MKTELLYLSDLALGQNLDRLSFSENNSLKLTKCNTENFFLQIKKSCKDNDIIFVDNSLFSTINQDDTLFKKITLIEKFYTDGEFYDSPAGAIVATYKNCLIAFLPDNDALFNDLIAFLIFKINFKFGYYAHLSLDVSQVGFDYIKKTIEKHFDYKNVFFSLQRFPFFTRVIVVANSPYSDDADDLCKQISEKFSFVFGDDCYKSAFAGLADLVVKKLILHNLKVATAESCTAGMISSALTGISGSSSVIELGITTYSNRIKHAALGVSSSTLKNYGAISFQTAYEMAHGIKNLSGADIGISITGVAGPLSSENKPVGTVYCALTNGKNTWTVKFDIENNASREFIRQKATFFALDLLRRYLEYFPLLLPQYSLDAQFLNFLYALPHYNLPAENPDLFYLEQNKNENVLEPTLEIVDDFDNSFTEKADYMDFDTELVVLDNTKKPFYSRFFKNSDLSLFSIIKNSAFGILIISIILTTLLVSSYFYAIKANDNSIEFARSTYKYSEHINGYGELLCIDILQDINPEIYGWLQIKNTEINNPVCLSNDNKYYKNHNYLGKYSLFGSLYFKNNCRFEKGNNSKNLVIYGKNANNNTMFGSLKDYNSFEHMKSNNIIELTTPYEKKEFYVFAAMLLSESAEDNGSDFDPAVTSFANKSALDNWLNEVATRSIYSITFTIPSDSEFVTLITDSDAFKGAKFVLIGFSSKSYFFEDFSTSLSVNHAPRYPQSWYDLHKSVNPFEEITPSSTPSKNESDEKLPNSSDQIVIIRPSDDTTTDTPKETSSNPPPKPPSSTPSQTSSQTPSTTPSETSSETSSTTPSDTSSTTSDSPSETPSDSE